MPALHDIVTKGSTDRSVVVHIMDSTDGTPETGVVFNTSGIDLWYRREGAARTAITEATLAALTTAHTDGGFLHVSDGDYRLDLPDAAFATGANYVDFGGTVTGMVVVGGRVKLIDADFEVASFGALRPTTAGRTLDVASTGEAGVDFDNILFSGNGPFAPLGIVDRGTAQAADANGITLRAGFSTAAANMVGKSVWVYSSTNGLHATGLATAYDNTTKVLTVSGLGEAPTGTVLYVVFATANGSTAAIADAVWDESTTNHTTAGTFGEQLKTDVDAILVDTGTTLDGRIPAALVSGRMDSSTGAMAANVLTATAINADAFTAAKFAADVTTEFQAGLATAAALTTVAGYLDTEIAAILALLDDPRGEPGQGAPPVNPDLATKVDYLYKAWRNRKTQTATEFALYADDGTTKDQESAVSSDGTTLVIGEMATGL